MIASALSRVYGDANPVLTYAVGGSGVVNGDSLTGVLATSATTGSNVGTYAITQGSLAASANYALSYVGADLQVIPRSVSVTADALSRIYGNANPTLTYVVTGATSKTGLINSDTLSGAPTTTAVASSNVGSYGISSGTLSAPNYVVNFTGATLSVTPATLTYIADPARRYVYTANPTLTGSVSGFVLSDTLVSAITGEIRFQSVAEPASPAGNYAIIGSGLTAKFGNYVFVQASENDSALTVKLPPSQPSSASNPPAIQGPGGEGGSTPLRFADSRPYDVNPLALAIDPCVAAGSATTNACVLAQARKDTPLQTASIR